jgi:GH15 family glucan-1,4-alpha-glucosidase
VGTTLDLILARLTSGGLLDRYEGQPDELADPCGPFVFPTFWMADALERCDRDGSELFARACASRGSTGLLGEVVDPSTGVALGNYPQVQSHAAFILAATDAGR